jgi:hypothetical protein
MLEHSQLVLAEQHVEAPGSFYHSE